MWEKQDPNQGSIHSVTGLYTWSSPTTYTMDGTMVSVHLAALNTSPCFAGHCDWRIPNRFELESIVDLEQYPNPAFNKDCGLGCTVDGAGGTTMCICTTILTFYWSSTTDQSGGVATAANAWGVRADGRVAPAPKNVFALVRAVRGGP